jgi:GcrA cell cycle regulator
MSWTDERVETLKRMWTEGQSASQIAKELGGVTRNAVIGKVHRLGLSNRVGGPGMPDGPDGGDAAAEGVTPDAQHRAGQRTEPRADPRADLRTDGRSEARADASPDGSDSARGDARGEPRGEPRGDGRADARPDARAGQATARPDPAQAAPAASPVMQRKPVVIAGQPLPPQPSANEISPEALASVREVEKKARRISLMELTERTCKWPIGDPATDDFWFCGLASTPGKPYCEAHVGVAFQPMSSRRDRRR